MEEGLKHDVIDWFEGISESAFEVQTDTLRKILEQNWGVEYLKKWFGDVNIQYMDASALESLYTSLVPLASHADFEPYINRIADGDTAHLLVQQPVSLFCIRFYPIREGGRIFEFIYNSRQFKTKGGLKVGTATTHYFASEEFKIKQEKTKTFTCRPHEVIFGEDYNQSTYCHLLLGLFFCDEVEFIASTFAYSIVQAFTTFEDVWREIGNDIKQGTLSERINLLEMRKAVLAIISPNPSLASKIEESCKKLENLNWAGSMLPYWKKLRHYSGGLPLVSADYASTESFIGVNVDPSLPPEDVTFANQDCSSAIDEFIEGELVPLSKVKVGQQYEVVLTTFTGLYRCRLGDVVEIAGFHNGTPKLSFMFRKKLILNVTNDKTTEQDLQKVVEMGSQLLMSKAGAELVDFTSHAEVENLPGHYIIYWEIKGQVEEEVIGECCNKMDVCFVEHGYVVSRRTNSIGPLELCIVQTGTFKKILGYFIGNIGGALSQFKTPRCTNNQGLLKILSESTVKRFYSTAYE
ncbi:unnamed protein product [Dovyalis caffra]|uniref:Uncharacterized protein n=1 Tax=Dovyalis caffra TaxID=77055 RepID=A0AAV1SFV7_9ROSI|nr:unnamed protein product [Dovyalis caffra]